MAALVFEREMAHPSRRRTLQWQAVKSEHVRHKDQFERRKDPIHLGGGK